MGWKSWEFQSIKLTVTQIDIWRTLSVVYNQNLFQPKFIDKQFCLWEGNTGLSAPCLQNRQKWISTLQIQSYLYEKGKKIAKILYLCFVVWSTDRSFRYNLYQVPWLTVCCAFCSMTFDAGTGLIHFGHEKKMKLADHIFLVYDQRIILLNCWHWANSAKPSLSSCCQSEQASISFRLKWTTSSCWNDNLKPTSLVPVFASKNLATWCSRRCPYQYQGNSDKNKTKVYFSCLLLYCVRHICTHHGCLHMYDHSIVQIELKYLLDHLLNFLCFVRVYRLRMGVWKGEGDTYQERDRGERAGERERLRERGGGGERETEREKLRERNWERERDWERETEKERHRETERDRERERDWEKERKRERERGDWNREKRLRERKNFRSR